MDAMKRISKLLAANKNDRARAAYRKMRNDCIVTTGRKTGDDKVCPICIHFCVGVCFFVNFVEFVKRLLVL